IQKGKLEGKIEGKLEGKFEGKLEEKLEIVGNAYDNGISISLISNITKLKEEEVLRILKQSGKMK
ncbi:MAG: hypothetical protein WBO36_04805, partial [Saprospiraceae bacterium]